MTKNQEIVARMRYGQFLEGNMSSAKPTPAVKLSDDPKQWGLNRRMVEARLKERGLK